MGKFRRLGKNTFLMFIGNMGSKSLSFFMLPFYTSFLSVTDYGTVDLIQVYVSLLVGICTCTLTEAIFVFPKGQEFAKQQAYFTSGILFSIVSLILTGGIFLTLVFILRINSYDGIFSEYNIYIYLMLCATFFQSYTQQFARSVDKINVYVISGIVLTITTVLVSLIMLPLWGVKGYIYSIILSYFIASVYTFWAAKEYVYISFKRISKNYLREMLKYSIPMMPNSIMWWILGTMNRPLLEHCIGIEAVGIFALSNKFPVIINMFNSIFIYSWQISVIEEFNKPDYKQFYNKIFRVQFLAFTLLLLVITFLSRPLIEIMTTCEYYSAWKYVPLLSMAVIFSSLAGLVGTNFLATKESKNYFTTSFWAGVLCFLLNILLIPKFGIWGAIISLLFANILMLYLRIRKTWKYSPITNTIIYFKTFFFVGIYIVVSYKIGSIYINLLCLLISMCIVFYINRTFLYETYVMYKEFKIKRK